MAVLVAVEESGKMIRARPRFFLFALVYSLRAMRAGARVSIGIRRRRGPGPIVDGASRRRIFFSSARYEVPKKLAAPTRSVSRVTRALSCVCTRSPVPKGYDTNDETAETGGTRKAILAAIAFASAIERSRKFIVLPVRAVYLTTTMVDKTPE